MDASEELNRLRWRCTRRAMRKMDILLGGFLEQHYASNRRHRRRRFATLAIYGGSRSLAADYRPARCENPTAG